MANELKYHMNMLNSIDRQVGGPGNWTYIIDALNSIDQGLTSYIPDSKDEIRDYVDDVLASIPADYALLNAKVAGEYVIQSLFEQGTINSSGNNATSTQRVRTKGYWRINQPTRIVANEGYMISLNVFVDGHLCNQDGSFATEAYLTNPNVDYRLNVRREDNGTMPVSEITQAISSEPIPEHEWDFSELGGTKLVQWRGFHKSVGGYIFGAEQTLQGCEMALRLGYRAIQQGVQFSKDGVPIIEQRYTINTTARNPDGSELGTDVKPSDKTLEELMEYDYGIYAGFAGQKVMTLETFIRWCKANNVFAVLELRTFTNTGGEPARDSDPLFSTAQLQAIIDVIKNNKMENNTAVYAVQYKLMLPFSQQLPTMLIGLNGNWSPISKSFPHAQQIKTVTNDIFLVCNRNANQTNTQLLLDSPYSAGYYTPASKSDIETLPSQKASILFTDYLLPSYYYQGLKRLSQS